MKNKDFDQIIREKIGNLSVNPQANSWELFEQQMLHEAGGTVPPGEQEIDQVVYDKLHQYEAPMSGANWPNLAERLDHEHAIQWEIYQYKGMELVIMLLLVWVSGQFIAFPSATQSASTPIIASEQSAPSELSSSDTPISSSDIHSSSSDRINENRVATNASSNNNFEATGSNSNDNATAETPLEEKETTDVIRLAEVQEPAPSSAASQKQTFIQPFNRLSTIYPSQIQSQTFASGLLGETATIPEALIAPGLVSVPEEIANTSLALLDYDSDETLPSILKKRKKKVHYQVGMFGSPDYNQVTSPSIIANEVNIPRYSRFSRGYSGGLTFGVGVNKWTFETGAIYSSKAYSPQEVYFLEGKLFQGQLNTGTIVDIELNILTVPLNARYTFYSKNRWSAYGTVGAAMNVAFQANYYTSSITPRNLGLAPTAPGAGPKLQPQEVINKPFRNGWFEGGTFEENSYLTANVGVGIERHYADRWSLFMQPTYYQSINYFMTGLGPFQDRINTFSIFAGVKIRL